MLRSLFKCPLTGRSTDSLTAYQVEEREPRLAVILDTGINVLRDCIAAVCGSRLVHSAIIIVSLKSGSGRPAERLKRIFLGLFGLFLGDLFFSGSILGLFHFIQTLFCLVLFSQSIDLVQERGGLVCILGLSVHITPRLFCLCLDRSEELSHFSIHLTDLHFSFRAYRYRFH